jgi:hypothetical protein
MKINESMNTDSPLCEFDVEWIGTFYKRMIQAATVSNLDEIRECMEWCCNIQGQVIEIVKHLSIDEDIHRESQEDDKHLGLEFVEKDYNKLITFVSGVGVAVSEMSDRLRVARRTMEYDQLRAQAEAMRSASIDKNSAG